VEIPEFSLDFIHWVHKTSVVRGARPKPDVPVRPALGGIKNAVRKEGLTDEPIWSIELSESFGQMVQQTTHHVGLSWVGHGDRA
jgi:hypothetical protein